MLYGTATYDKGDTDSFQWDCDYRRLPDRRSSLGREKEFKDWRMLRTIVFSTAVPFEKFDLDPIGSHVETSSITQDLVALLIYDMQP